MTIAQLIYQLRLVPVVGYTLSILTTNASAAAYTSLQYPAHSHISISHVSFLSPSQLHHYRLNHFR
jgi:hypothetical protein